MYARQVFRCAQPLQNQARHYATEVPKPSGGSSKYIYGGVAAVGLVAWGVSSRSRRKKFEEEFLKSKEGQKLKSEWDAKTGKEAAKPTFTGGDQGFIGLKLESVQNVNHNTKKFRFALPDPDSVSGLPITSALLTKYKGPEDEKPTVRPYTPISDEGEKGYLELLIKKYPNGPMSTHLHNMVPGQRLDFKGPLPKYPWSPNKHSHVTLIAGGTGITPMYQLARNIFNNPEDKTKVTLVFGNVSEEDILLKEELQDLESTYPQRFRAFYVLDNPPKSWTGGKGGHIDKEILKTVLPEPKEDNIKIFVCGPPGMYKAISGLKPNPKDQGELEGILKELGYSKDQVFKF